MNRPKCQCGRELIPTNMGIGPYGWPKIHYCPSCEPEWRPQEEPPWKLRSRLQVCSEEELPLSYQLYGPHGQEDKMSTLILPRVDGIRTPYGTGVDVYPYCGEVNKAIRAIETELRNINSRLDKHAKLHKLEQQENASFVTLLPCPFCGHPSPKLESSNNETERIFCPECYCQTEWSLKPSVLYSPSSAKSTWNRRTPS